MKKHTPSKLLRRRAADGTTTVMGVAWFRPEQWQRLREMASDRDELEETYEEWVRNAENGMQVMRQSGLRLEKIDVDVEELLLWCQARNYAVNGGARAEYAADKLRQLHESKSQST